MNASSIGTTLREARSRKALSLEDVHSRIKIHPRVLQLLEEDKFDKLPSPLFVKSFIKSYAELLEINPRDLIQLYEKDKKEPEQVLFIKPSELRDRKSTISRETVTKIIAVAVVILVLFGAVKVSAWAIGGIKKAFSAKMAASPKKSKTVKKSKSVEVEDAAPAVAAVKEEPVKEDSAWLRSVEQKNFPKIAKKTKLTLKVKATDNVWMRITSDGKVLFESTLKKNKEETWYAQDQIEIWSGNTSLMKLNLNNYDLGVISKGVVKKLVVDREGVRIA